MSPLSVSNKTNVSLCAIASPLRVSSDNPRYFAESSTGRIVYLTGSHTWNNFQDAGADTDGDGVPDYIRDLAKQKQGRFDFGGYVDFMARNNHNFMRLWMWEHPRWSPWSHEDNLWKYPLPFARTGPGLSRDGLPKFDVERFEPLFFARLRERVEKALRQGIYVGIMLFGGASIGNLRWPNHPSRNPWDSHPFHRDNNINGIDGDPDGSGQGWDTHRLKNVRLLGVQQAYLRKVIDTVNDLDNVLYEISNEDPFNSYLWHYDMIRYIKDYQAAKPKQHPVGMTIAWSMDNDRLLESPADWFSPSEWEHDLPRNPWTYDGNAGHPGGPKVLIVDTDHVFFGPTTLDFTWKAFCRGQNVISMEHTAENDLPLQYNEFHTSEADRVQSDVKKYADRMNLAMAEPHNQLSSTSFCLAHPGREYLIFQPDHSPFQVDLSESGESKFAVEWFNAESGDVTGSGSSEWRVYS